MAALQPNNKPATAKERAEKKGLLQKEVLFDRFMADGYTTFEPFEKEAFHNHLEEGRYIAEPITEENILDTLKNLKDILLSERCNKEIKKGFTADINGNVYHFSYDIEAQVNFGDATSAFDKGLMTETRWTVRKGGENGEYTRIVVTPEVMLQLNMDILKAKNKQISHYRDVLLPYVKTATTISELDSIHWGDDLPEKPPEEPDKDTPTDTNTQEEGDKADKSTQEGTGADDSTTTEG